MKCISLWQPWATLIAIGAKRIETRSWETLHRGPIAIHAAKKRSLELDRMCVTSPFAEALGVRMHGRQILYKCGEKHEPMPFGCIVAVASLVKVVRTEAVTFARHSGAPLKVLDAGADVMVEYRPDDAEMAFGDYSPGRFAWLLADVKPFPAPLPWRGEQGMFDVPDEAVYAGVTGSLARVPGS